MTFVSPTGTMARSSDERGNIPSPIPRKEASRQQPPHAVSNFRAAHNARKTHALRLYIRAIPRYSGLFWPKIHPASSLVFKSFKTSTETREGRKDLRRQPPPSLSSRRFCSKSSRPAVQKSRSPWPLLVRPGTHSTAHATTSAHDKISRKPPLFPGYSRLHQAPDNGLGAHKKCGPRIQDPQATLNRYANIPTATVTRIRLSDTPRAARAGAASRARRAFPAGCSPHAAAVGATLGAPCPWRAASGCSQSDRDKAP